MDTTEVTDDAAYATPLQKLNRDIKSAALKMSRDEARFLVNLYYTMQEHRIATTGQARSLDSSAEPHEAISFFSTQAELLEGQVRAVLDSYSKGSQLGMWMRSQKGLGPVLTAGLLAHVDIAACPSYGNVWAFAGLVPTQKWLGRDGASKSVAETHAKGVPLVETVAALAAKHHRNAESLMRMATVQRDGSSVPLSKDRIISALARRPWNADLKKLCWLLGESFVKTSGRDGAFYGLKYAERKAEEIQRNDNGEFAQQAAQALADKNYGKDTEAYKAYVSGKLPPAHIHARAKRYAVKLFLSHMWQVGREIEGLPVGTPYPIVHLGHVHVIPPPNWPMV